VGGFESTVGILLTRKGQDFKECQEDVGGGGTKKMDKKGFGNELKIIGNVDGGIYPFLEGVVRRDVLESNVAWDCSTWKERKGVEEVEWRLGEGKGKVSGRRREMTTAYLGIH